MNNSISKTLRWFWREWGKPLLLVAVVIAPFRASIADWYDVPTGSMRPTILDGDRVFVNKLAYDLKIPFTSRQIACWANPARGDVVVLRSPSDNIRLVKRVIGLPGEIISLDGNRLTINGQPVEYLPVDPLEIPLLEEKGKADCSFFTESLPGRPHSIITMPSIPAYRTIAPLKIPEGKYFVMGDNRDNSADSRYFGFVDRSRIIGQATTIVFSLDHKRYFMPRNRFFLSL